MKTILFFFIITFFGFNLFGQSKSETKKVKVVKSWTKVGSGAKSTLYCYELEILGENNPCGNWVLTVQYSEYNNKYIQDGVSAMKVDYVLKEGACSYSYIFIPNKPRNVEASNGKFIDTNNEIDRTLEVIQLSDGSYRISRLRMGNSEMLFKY